jgi:hypothetical protein
MMGSRPPVTRGGLLWLACSVALGAWLTACKPTPAVPAEGSGQTAAVEASGSGEAAPALHRHEHHRDENFSQPYDAVGFAIFKARYEVASRAADSLRVAPVTSPVERPTGSKALRILLGSNIHGELEDCGCKHHPLGGLARRAHLLDHPPSPADVTLHLDAGDALFKSMQPSLAPMPDTAPDIVAARAIADAFAAMKLDAMTVGPYDLNHGSRRAVSILEKAGVPVVSATLQVDGKAPFAASRRIDRGGLAIEVVGATLRGNLTDAQWEALGVTLLPAAEPVGRAIAAARGRGASAVVLLASGGVEATRSLLDELSRAGTQPDLALVSGSSRVLNEPLWSGTVPLFESGDRGKMLLDLSVFYTATPLRIAPEGGELFQRIRGYMTLLRASNSVASGLARRRGSPDAEQRSEQTLREQYARLRLLEVELARLAAGASSHGAPAEAGAKLSARMVQVELSGPERPDVKRIVDAAKATIGPAAAPVQVAPNR